MFVCCIFVVLLSLIGRSDFVGFPQWVRNIRMQKVRSSQTIPRTQPNPWKIWKMETEYLHRHPRDVPRRGSHRHHYRRLHRPGCPVIRFLSSTSHSCCGYSGEALSIGQIQRADGSVWQDVFYLSQINSAPDQYGKSFSWNISNVNPYKIRGKLK